MMKLRLDKNQYVKDLNTDKAFAIQFSRGGNNNMLFLSKKFAKLREVTIYDSNSVYKNTEYNIELPEWLYEKMNGNQQVIIDLLKDQWIDENKVYEGVEMLNKINAELKESEDEIIEGMFEKEL